MTGTRRMSEKRANAIIDAYENKKRINAIMVKEAKERGDPPPSGPVFRPRTPPGGTPGSPLESPEQQYEDAQAARDYYEEQRAASLNKYATPTPTTITAPAPTDEEFRNLLDRLGVKRPVKNAKGGLIKSRKKSSRTKSPRKKSIDGIARRGKTRGKHR